MSSQTSEPIEKSQERLKNVLQISFYASITILIMSSLAIILDARIDSSDYNLLILFIFSILSIALILWIRSRAKISLFLFSSKISTKCIFNFLLICILGMTYSCSSLIDEMDKFESKVEIVESIIVRIEQQKQQDSQNKKNSVQSSNLQGTISNNKQSDASSLLLDKKLTDTPKNNDSSANNSPDNNSPDNNSVTNELKDSILAAIRNFTDQHRTSIINFLKIIMLSFLSFLAAHLFFVRDKIDDYLDSLDEDNQNQETKPQPQPEQPLN